MLSALVLAASLVFTESDADFALQCASNLVENCTPRDAGTIRGVLASNWLLDNISRNGVDVKRDRFSVITPKGRRTMSNLSCRFATNPDDEWVVVVSHYDTKPSVACPGANDGASTTGLLMALARIVAERGLPRGNLMLIWTSKRAVDVLKESGVKVRAAICVDMLGDKDLDICIPANGDNTLSSIACHAARRANLGPCFRGRIREVVKDDHTAFLTAGWRAIDLIDFNYGSAHGLNDYWHTPEDTVDKISPESLYKSGRLLVELLNIIL